MMQRLQWFQLRRDVTALFGGALAVGDFGAVSWHVAKAWDEILDTVSESRLRFLVGNSVEYHLSVATGERLSH